MLVGLLFFLLKYDSGSFGRCVRFRLVLIRLRIRFGVAGGDVELFDELRDAELRHHQLVIGQVVREAVLAALLEPFLHVLKLGHALLVQILELAERRGGVVAAALDGARALEPAADAHDRGVARLQHHERERALLSGGLALLHAGHHIRHVLQPLFVHALELVKALGELGLGVTVGGVAALFQFAGQTFHSICILQM